MQAKERAIAFLMNYPAAELRGIKMFFILLTPMQSIEEFF